MIWCLHVFVLAQNINQLLLSINFTGIELKTIYTLRSWSSSFLVSVSGFVKSTDFHGPRKFGQIFILAPQMNRFFVQNEVFYFTGKIVSSQSHVPVANERSVHQQPTVSSHLPDAPGIVDLSVDIWNMPYFHVKLNIIVRDQSNVGDFHCFVCQLSAFCLETGVGCLLLAFYNPKSLLHWLLQLYSDPVHIFSPVLPYNLVLELFDYINSMW